MLSRRPLEFASSTALARSTPLPRRIPQLPQAATSSHIDFRGEKSTTPTRRFAPARHRLALPGDAPCRKRARCGCQAWTRLALAPLPLRFAARPDRCRARPTVLPPAPIQDPRPSVQRPGDPKKGGGLVRSGKGLDYAQAFGFMRANQAAHAVRRMSRLLGVSASGYYACRAPLNLRRR